MTDVVSLPALDPNPFSEKDPSKLLKEELRGFIIIYLKNKLFKTLSYCIELIVIIVTAYGVQFITDSFIKLLQSDAQLLNPTAQQFLDITKNLLWIPFSVLLPSIIMICLVVLAVLAVYMLVRVICDVVRNIPTGLKSIFTRNSKKAATAPTNPS